MIEWVAFVEAVPIASTKSNLKRDVITKFSFGAFRRPIAHSTGKTKTRFRAAFPQGPQPPTVPKFTFSS